MGRGGAGEAGIETRAGAITCRELRVYLFSLHDNDIDFYLPSRALMKRLRRSQPLQNAPHSKGVVNENKGQKAAPSKAKPVPSRRLSVHLEFGTK